MRSGLGQRSALDTESTGGVLNPTFRLRRMLEYWGTLELSLKDIIQLKVDRSHFGGITLAGFRRVKCLFIQCNPG